jgi:DNA-directed RNA polymerase specialized sigma subunit
MADEAEMIMEWQRTKDPTLFSQLSIRYKPVVENMVNQYRTVGVSPSTLRANAQSQMIKAFVTYDPSKGTQPITHVYNNMKKVQRVASESLISGHIPEARNLKRATFHTALINLTDRLGYEPNIDQISDELGWGKKEAARMYNELSGETTASGAKFDFYGNATQAESKDKALADLLYHELEDKDKVIFEHTFGYAGKPVLSNKDIAKKLNVNDMWITRRKKAMSEKIASYR